ncbi:hypothetical protein D9M68_572770 [compost metagenome]
MPDSKAPTISLPLFLLVMVLAGALWPKWRKLRPTRQAATGWFQLACSGASVSTITRPSRRVTVFTLTCCGACCAVRLEPLEVQPGSAGISSNWSPGFSSKAVRLALSLALPTLCSSKRVAPAARVEA